MGHHEPMLLLLMTSLTGCGDPLLNGASVGARLETQVPTEPSWNLRWLAPTGVSVSCEVEEIKRFDEAALILGALELLPPVLPEPPVWVDESEHGYSYALALLTVIDEELWELRATPEEALTGTWGVSETWAVLFVDGDLDAAALELLAGDGDEGITLESNLTWVGWAPELILATGTPEGALFFPADSQYAALDATGVPVTSMLYADAATAEVVSGAAVGGAVLLEGCPEHDEDDEVDE